MIIWETLEFWDWCGCFCGKNIGTQKGSKGNQAGLCFSHWRKAGNCSTVEGRPDYAPSIEGRPDYAPATEGYAPPLWGLTGLCSISRWRQNFIRFFKRKPELEQGERRNSLVKCPVTRSISQITTRHQSRSSWANQMVQMRALCFRSTQRTASWGCRSPVGRTNGRHARDKTIAGKLLHGDCRQ